MRPFSALSFALLVAAGPAAASDVPDLRQLQAMTARFAPVDVRVDVSKLPGSERAALAKTVAAAKIMDALFLRQVWAGNESLLLDLLRDETPLGRARLHYLRINKGPWSRLDHNAPFIPGVGVKPDSGNFYPAGATRDELDAWMKGLPAAQKEEATASSRRSGAAPTGSS